MIVSLVSIFLLGSFDLNIDYAFSIYKTQDIESRRSLLPGRHDTFGLGLSKTLFRSSGLQWKLTPQLLFMNSFVGVETWFGPQAAVEMGPKLEKFFLITGLGLSPHVSILIDDPKEPGDGGVSAAERTAFALGLQAYLGPRFGLGRNYSLSLLCGPRFYYGSIPEHSFRTSWSSNWGALFFTGLQLGFISGEVF